MRLLTSMLLVVGLLAFHHGLLAQQGDVKVRARVQERPGGPVKEIEMKVHASPVDPERVLPADVELTDDDLVIGLIVDGQPVAYPVRYLAPYEVINDRVRQTAITPTW